MPLSCAVCPVPSCASGTRHWGRVCTGCARLVGPASGVRAAARPGSVRGGGRERQRTGAATALVFSVRWEPVGMCQLHRSSTVTIRRLVVVEAEKVLRAWVIAEERLGAWAPRWAMSGV